ncbi:MAG: tetratricopeptide repeat protein [Candidatus Methylomirabilia bacterium]
MSIRFGLLLALVFGAVVAYLAAFNTSRVSLALAPDLVYELPLMALVVGAFLAGAAVMLLVTTFRDLGRSFHDYRLARRVRRLENLSDMYHRGVDAQLAGRREEATKAYEGLLTREPGHVEAHLRLGDLARAQGDYQAAQEHHQHALRSGERVDALLALAEDLEHAGKTADALATYRRILQHDRNHLTALRATRSLYVARGEWEEALAVQERLVSVASAQERGAELEWLAGIRYEVGQALLAQGTAAEARRHFTEVLKADRAFLPAALALGESFAEAGERREAVRIWERAAQGTHALVLLRRLELVFRAEGRPARMIALYQDALDRAPQDLALTFALGRVYVELEMLDEAADQFQKLEVRAPDLVPVRVSLATIYERRGQLSAALEECRRALTLLQAYQWPHRCRVCDAPHADWQDRCPRCGRWNTSRP